MARGSHRRRRVSGRDEGEQQMGRLSVIKRWFAEVLFMQGQAFVLMLGSCSWIQDTCGVLLLMASPCPLQLQGCVHVAVFLSLFLCSLPSASLAFAARSITWTAGVKPGRFSGASVRIRQTQRSHSWGMEAEPETASKNRRPPHVSSTKCLGRWQERRSFARFTTG